MQNARRRATGSGFVQGLASLLKITDEPRWQSRYQGDVDPLVGDMQRLGGDMRRVMRRERANEKARKQIPSAAE
ncbi:hypothetical protein [Nitratireductor rhodophyticola]|uniref:hypothetical protein n=1 Tax=Nitratireductor rhodophyticola TaxID=2854036 RepID=UPI003BAB60C2